MELMVLPFALSVCKLASWSSADLERPFFFLCRTAEELSLVCPTADVPGETLAREDGWRGFYIAGELDFSLVGILARIADILAREGVSLFAVSTYNTDYILVKEENFGRAKEALRREGYKFT